jgi:UDP-glucose 4-epimerase
VVPVKILVTGGSGFIGRAIVPGLRAFGHEVLAPTHPELDLVDAEAVRDFLRHERPDVIVHGATKPAHRNAADPSCIVETNERMFFNLVRDCELCPRMVFLSSGAVYDAEHYQSRMPEAYFDVHVPADEHGFSKYVIAKYVEQAEHIVELRVFGIFGPHEDYAIRFISNAICKTLFDLPVTLRQDREFSYLWVEDLVPVVAHFATREGAHGAYNVAPDDVVNLKDLARLVVEVSGTHVPVLVEAAGEGAPYSADNARLRAEIPDLAFTPVREAVERLHRWYAERRDTIDRSQLLSDK